MEDEVESNAREESDSNNEAISLAQALPVDPLGQQLSRLHSEFEELQWLGKGGFGDVVKVI